MHRVVTIESPDTCCKLRSKRMIHCILLLVIIDLVVVYLWTHILHFWGAISLYKCPSTVLMKCCLFLSTGKLWHAYGENVCATFIWSWVILLLTLSWMLLNQLYIYIYIYIYIYMYNRCFKTEVHIKIWLINENVQTRELQEPFSSLLSSTFSIWQFRVPSNFIDYVYCK
jgi:hypothetical protein